MLKSNALAWCPHRGLVDHLEYSPPSCTILGIGGPSRVWYMITELDRRLDEHQTWMGCLSPFKSDVELQIGLPVFLLLWCLGVSNMTHSSQLLFVHDWTFGLLL